MESTNLHFVYNIRLQFINTSTTSIWKKDINYTPNLDMINEKFTEY
jgi:hypothetical protein